MDINQLLETFTNAVAVQEDIITWSTTAYGHTYNVFENMDFRNPPDADDCPLVVFSPGTKIGGLSQGVKSHGIGVDLLVYDSEMPVDDNGVIRFNGGRKVEEFRQLVLAKILSAMPGNCHLESVRTEYETIDQFPYVFAGMDLVITEEKIIGQNPYE